MLIDDIKNSETYENINCRAMKRETRCLEPALGQNTNDGDFIFKDTSWIW